MEMSSFLIFGQIRCATSSLSIVSLRMDANIIMLFHAKEAKVKEPVVAKESQVELGSLYASLSVNHLQQLQEINLSCFLFPTCRISPNSVQRRTLSSWAEDEYFPSDDDPRIFTRKRIAAQRTESRVRPRSTITFGVSRWINYPF